MKQKELEKQARKMVRDAMKIEDVEECVKFVKAFVEKLTDEEKKKLKDYLYSWKGVNKLIEKVSGHFS